MTFFISCQISGQFDPWMPPPVLHHAPVTTFFSSFFAIYLHFFNKNWPLGCPPGWMPGAVAPSAPPLHATPSTVLISACPLSKPSEPSLSTFSIRVVWLPNAGLLLPFETQGPVINFVSVAD